jgi:hypothetical protein
MRPLHPDRNPGVVAVDDSESVGCPQERRAICPDLA